MGSNERAEHRRGFTESQNKDFSSLLSTSDHIGQLRSRGQGNFFSLGWETVLEDLWTTNWVLAWRCGKEMGMLYFFPPWSNVNDGSCGSVQRWWHLKSREKGTIECHSDGTLQQESLPQVYGPAIKQHTYYSVRMKRDIEMTTN
jgi:hypothetical protein